MTETTTPAGVRTLTADDLPDVPTFVDLFEAQAERAPDRIAVVAGDRRLTYAELNAAAEAVRLRLEQAGVTPGDLVALYVDRSADMVSALLGVLKAGAAYLPLDPAYPAARIAMILEDSGTAAILTQRHLRSSLPNRNVLTLEDITPNPEISPKSERKGSDRAYVLYTSGSTGRPKGVVIPHRALLNFLWAMRTLLNAAPDDIWLALTSLSFDISGLELYLPLITGARLVIADTETARDGARLRTLVETERITHLQATPSGWRVLLDAGFAGTVTGLVGGEALPVSLARTLTDRLTRLVNVYGPTETTIWSTAWEVSRGTATVSIGTPIANTQVHILDDRLEPVAEGELHLGGLGVADGYLARPALTAERFVPDPYGPPGARLYRTGDLVRRRPDGALDFLGRADTQVKLRGHRIELGEIETVLEELPGVRQAVVAVHGEVLVAYLVGDGVDPREALAERLPPYMVPSAVVRLDAMPLTPNGKVDRRALPAPARSTGEIAPRTESERVVAEAFAEVLGLDEVGAEADFFAVGGHSLLATKVTARLTRRLGVEIPVRELFAAPTVAGLAAVLDGLDTVSIPLEPRPPGTPVLLSPAQERLWFLHRLDPEDASQNLHLTRRLRGPLDVAALERALTAAVARHEALRTRFPDLEGRPVAVIEPDPAITLEQLAAATEDEARALLAARVNAPFDLAAAPPVRAVLVRVGGEHMLCVVFHGIAGDEWSLDVLIEDLADPDREPPAVQHGDVVAWQQGREALGLGADALAHWRERLAGLPVLRLATDRPRPAVAARRGAVVRARVPVGPLEELAQRHGTTLFSVLLAAYQAVLSAETGQHDFGVGAPTAGRGRVELEPVFGRLGNVLVLRADLSGAPSFAELLARARATVLAAMAEEEVPVERLQAELDLVRDTGQTPLYQTMLALDTLPEPVQVCGAVAEPFELDQVPARFDLTLDAWRDGGELALVFTYDATLFDQARIDALAARFTAVLNGADLGVTGVEARPVVQVDRAPAPRTGRAPGTPAERRIARVFGEVVGVEQMGADDDFFALGGRSLLAPRAAALLSKAFGVPVPVRAIFANPTVSGLAAAIGADPGVVPLEPRPPGTPVPLSAAQERLWFMDHFDPGDASGNMYLARRIYGPLDRERFTAAYAALVDRHESLRTRFPADDGRPLLVIDQQGQAEPAWLELPEERVRGYCAAQVNVPFDLAAAPPVRAALIRITPEDHVICVAMHHIIADGWSVNVMFSELAALYEGVALPPLPVQAGDVSIWQLKREALDEGEAALAHWRDRLAGVPVLELPLDRPRPLDGVRRGAVHQARVPADLVAGLEQAGRESGVTLFMVLLAAYQALLARHTGQPDFAVGSPTAARGRVELESVIGYLAHTLVLRADLSGDPPFHELLRRTWATVVDALAHQEVPVERLKSVLGVRRDLGQSALFQTMLILHSQTTEGNLPARFAGMRHEPYNAGAIKTAFDLTLTAWPVTDGLNLVFDYDAALFDGPTVERLAARLVECLYDIAADPTTRVSMLSMRTPEDDAALATWTQGPNLEISGGTLLDLIERQPADRVAVTGSSTHATPGRAGPAHATPGRAGPAHATPGRGGPARGGPAHATPAHVTPAHATPAHATPAHGGPSSGGVTSGHLTYGELRAAAHRLAARLRAEGVGRGDLVAILAERSPDALTGMLATMLVGAAYLPLDPDYPQARIAFVLADARPRVILADRSFGEAGEIPVIQLGAAGEEGSPSTVAGQDAGSAENGAAGGSGAIPVIPLRHAGPLLGGMDEATRDISGSDFASPLPEDPAYVLYTSGSTGRPKGVVVPHRALLNFLVSMRELLDAGPEDVWLALTSLSFDISGLELYLPLVTGGRIVMADPETALDGRALARLVADHGVTHVQATPSGWRVLLDGELPQVTALVGGEALTQGLARELRTRVTRLINVYGPTETTIWSTAWEVPADPAELAIGRPIGNTQVAVVDEHLRPVPPRAPGELLIGGLGLAHGYLRRPGLTAERFVPGPGGTRLYRTGDLVRWRWDGTLEYLGRNDDQVKLRGHRIEPGEIESVLESLPGVDRAAVAVRGDNLVAYVVGETAGLREELIARLPSSLVPAAFVRLDALPLTPNGKLDRLALPDPEPGREDTFVAPRTDAEALVADVWSDLLGLDGIGAFDDFFQLGGHSLLAVRVAARLRGTVGVEVSIRTLFTHTTVADLASAVEDLLLAELDDLSDEEAQRLMEKNS
ncbi:non-ribosomal peptide synthetase [Acrocarpospora catenulata]|uniref:non-ribosomal peptide synthetase n=1 Tax=Acrocarpospora catenulata TaxID=2836182 RepID=UPI001BDA721C|nr:non-ribosomal peptide synthetase [Acrocarpospora catenulata]